MKKRLKEKWLQTLVLGTACTALALAIWHTAGLGRWEDYSWDRRVSYFAGREPASEKTIMILLDQNSLDWAQAVLGVGWPWPREIYSSIADFCGRQGARALGFDVLFSEPSAYGVQDDQRFASALAVFGKSAASVSLSHFYGKDQSWPKAAPMPNFKTTGLTELKKIALAGGFIFPHAGFPIPEIARSASVLCNASIPPDPDSIYRRIPFISLFDDQVLPGLGLGMLLAAAPDIGIRAEKGRVIIGDTRIPVDKQGRAVLRYQGRAAELKSFSAASVIQSELRLRRGESPTIKDPDAFRDKYVFFGFSAPGLFDNHPAPHDSNFPGVAIHMTWLDNFLEKQFMKKTSFAFDFAFILLLCLLAAATIFLFPEPGPGVGIGIAFLSIPILTGMAAYPGGIWTPIVLPQLSLALTLAGGFIINYATEGRKKRFIKAAFKQYLSPHVIEQLIQNPEKLRLGGERRELSIMFSDIQGFTSISEKLDPEALTNFLNEYLSIMTDIIQSEGGTIDKYEGDAVIAFWNAPIAFEDHAARSVGAALTCRQRLSEMKTRFRQQTGSDIFTRIGINTGFAVVGNMGSKTRFDFTMIGDAVNLAARLESANKIFGTSLMVSESTRRQAGDVFAFRNLGKIRVKGRKEPVTVYEPFFHHDYENSLARLEIFASGRLAFCRGDFADCLRILSPIRDSDPAADAYAGRAEKINDRPLPEAWEGVWEMTEK